MSLKTKLKEMIIRELKIEDVQAEEIEDAAPLFGEGLGLDSLDAVELVLMLQRHFGVDIKDMEQARSAFDSINALSDYVVAHQKPS